MNRLRNERGIALAIAMFALVVIGGLVAGAMFVATQEQRIGRNTLQHQAAFTAAEAGTQDAVLNWNTGYDSLHTGGQIATRATAPDGQGWYRRTIQRLGTDMFLVRTDGFNRDSTSRSRVGMLIRLKPLAFNINAALKTQGALKIGGSSYINGQDTPPSNWADCPDTVASLPGIRVPDPTEITTAGCGSYSCVDGNPKVQKDTTITQASLTTVGDIPFDSLEQFANKFITTGGTVQPSLNGDGTCNTGDLYNWGDPLVPTAPCGSYFPIIWASGGVHLTGNYGQGVLIVDGDLTVTGGFEFYGPVLIKGTLNTQGTGGHFNGGVIAANINLDQSDVLGNAVINFSSCALMKALTHSATVSTVSQRSWVNLY
jgi:PilX N-terminal